MLDKIPPHNIEFEKSILSTVFFDHESIHDIDLLPDDFYNANHQIIFDAMLKIKGSGKNVDVLIVADSLTASGTLNHIGGVTALSKLMDEPVSINIEHYCSTIKEKASLRNMIKISYDTIQQCFDESIPAVDVIQKAHSGMASIDSGEKGITDVRLMLEDNITKLSELKKNGGGLSGLPTGFSKLNAFTSGLQDTDLILLGARPSMGKTSLAMNIVRNVAFHFYPTLVFSFEMSKEQVLNRLISDMSSVNGMKFKSGLFGDGDWKKIDKANRRLYDMPIHIIDKSGMTVQEISATARTFKRKHGIKFVMLDYVQLIKGWNRDGQGSKSEISNELKGIAKSLNLPVLALSQLNRSLESRSDKRPIMSDLREAGALEQDADVIFFVYRDEVYNKTGPEGQDNKGDAELLVRKNRNGIVGKIKLDFIPEFTRFEDFKEFNQ